MIHRLKLKDILALGFMTFALFVGAGNIIFPPMIGIQSGEHMWLAGFGFMISAVGLPVMTIIAVARAGGGIEKLSLPIGKTAGLFLAILCYLAIGPFFATPRTASVSFEVGLAPLTGNTPIPLFIYSVIYFCIVIIISLYPGKLLDTVGHFLAPLKISALTLLCITVLFWPTGKIYLATVDYQSSAFSNGFLNGYLTMDTLGALVFGIVIVNAARSRGVQDAILLTRYTIWAGLISGIGLTLVYISLFKLGSGSSNIVSQNANGAEILNAYVQQNFGSIGAFFLAALISVACMVTAVGLTCSCAQFFSQYVPLSYKTLVYVMSISSTLISNFGLNHLIQISIPVLTAIYPPCIVLVILSFTLRWWNKNTRIIIPTMLISLIFGILDAIKTTKFKPLVFLINEYFPLADQEIAWLIPSLITFSITAFIDRVKG
ncbi:branched-chain amino acid transport system II carrier protein [Candidatus Pantoea carbekii]|uniref:Branched-chain amino acid transport system carrier protein n=1 Tax=Candidatus Pantoea carbekii TaxID=1235990 RepID=U3U6Z4_9GAMM|nr:branched-chain amino acid transport system II carrier protein [Candidatus Pantoea carbekii]AKC32234.1 branched-chain amino acid transport system II carrier protein BrnQ [Candidatus Pantoea carbekii]BAO00770.1 BrnQ protein [Candidatus Pantoea carbekii]